jgi:hypothetical protein
MAAKKILCPLLKSECLEDSAVLDGELCGCRFWITIIGKDPTTGAPINRGDCAIAWQPVLLIENSQMQRHTGAAVEDFRNEMLNAQAATNEVLNRILMGEDAYWKRLNNTHLVQSEQSIGYAKASSIPSHSHEHLAVGADKL